MTATFDTASKQLSWKGSVSGLTGPATAAHFHAGESGKNGAVVVPITGADKGSFEGSATLTDAQAEELMAGKWYVNVHTAANKAGEIRGQVDEISTGAIRLPTSMTPPALRRRVFFHARHALRPASAGFMVGTISWLLRD